jgi:radical SAM superfamily enzyme YgiQ (UPF0313 family)
MSRFMSLACGRRKAAAAVAESVTALLVVPPFLNYSAGPLLGPSLLQAAARDIGHVCNILDLNALWIQRFRDHNTTADLDRGLFVGDHDKPVNRKVLRDAERFLYDAIIESMVLEVEDPKEIKEKIQYGFLMHDEVESMSNNLAHDEAPTSFGSWARRKLQNQDLPPSILGFSIMHAGQVIPSVAIGIIARELWPEILIVWGGPHISGIGEDAFQSDLWRRRYAADIFVAGHAEETFVDILNQQSSRLCRNEVQFKRGEGVSTTPYAPMFDNLHLYDDPPVLPAQSTLGCAYGRCKFCTYPKMEPVPRKLDLTLAVMSVVDQAELVGGTVALKDSLVTPKRLSDIADIICCRVKWSACTKLHPKLVDVGSIAHLEYNGLATLEVGLESLLPETQRRVAKEHPPFIFEDFLAVVSNVGDLTLVVNYITDFPWEGEDESQAGLQAAMDLVKYYLGDRGKVEHNTFQLERQSPMAQCPEKYDICSWTLRFYPWASIVEYDRLI